MYVTLLVCFFTPLWIFLSMVVFRKTQNIYVLLTRTCAALTISFAYHSFNKCILSVYKNVISDYYVLLNIILYIIVHSNKLLYCACPQSLSCIWLFATPWTVACHAPLSMGFSRQEYWSALVFPPPGERPNAGIETASPALADRFFTTEPPGKPLCYVYR